jgi:hypothetical protein
LGLSHVFQDVGRIEGHVDPVLPEPPEADTGCGQNRFTN